MMFYLMAMLFRDDENKRDEKGTFLRYLISTRLVDGYRSKCDVESIY